MVRIQRAAGSLLVFRNQLLCFLYFSLLCLVPCADLQLDLQRLLQQPRLQSFVRRETLCRTLAGNSCDLLTITEEGEGLAPLLSRQGAHDLYVLTGRHARLIGPLIYTYYIISFWYYCAMKQHRLRMEIKRSDGEMLDKDSHWRNVFWGDC